MRLPVPAVALLACAATLHGQVAVPGDPPAADCLAAIPASALTRVPIYLEAEADPDSRAVLPLADSLVQTIGRVIRVSFGAGDALPVAEAPLHWRQLDGGVQVAIHRDGRLTWSSIQAPSADAEAGAPPDTGFNESRNLVVQALMFVRGAGVTTTWPAGASGDSLSFTLRYAKPLVKQDGTIRPLQARFAVPVFSMAVPWERELTPGRMSPPRYPGDARDAGMEATVILRFVVDSTGRVKRGTVTDRWMSSTPRPTGDLGRHYRLFVEAAIRSVENAQFLPALVGGCAVDQQADMPFVFGFRR